MRRWWLVTMPAAALAFGACAENRDGDMTGAPDDEGPVISVVASFYPLAWVAEQVGGDGVAVSGLTPPGVDPHDLELTPAQRAEIEDADLVVVMGNGFQPAVETAAEARSAPTVVVFSELVSVDAEGRRVADDDHATEDEDEHGHTEIDLEDTLDPHVWLDPLLMTETVHVIEEALVEIAPEKAGTFETNAAALGDELATLDGEFEAALADCETRVLVTAHDAFGYLAARYGLEPQGVAGLSPDAEPDPARLAELADLVAEKGIQVVFTEETVSPAIGETLASEAGVDTDVLSNLESLAPEAEEAGQDYLSVMRANLDAISTGLGCT